jgi:hypothetical protein
VLLAPVFILLLLAAVLGPAARWLVFSSRALAPKLERLDPVRGLQRMFSVRSLVELLKAIAKVLLVGAITLLLLCVLRGELATMAMQSLEPAIRHAVTLIAWSAIALSASTLLIAAVDVPFQLFDHARKLRMTVQQVRDELKESEGRPEVKSRFASCAPARAQPHDGGRAEGRCRDHQPHALRGGSALRRRSRRRAMLLGCERPSLKIPRDVEAHGVPVVAHRASARSGSPPRSDRDPGGFHPWRRCWPTCFTCAITVAVADPRPCCRTSCPSPRAWTSRASGARRVARSPTERFCCAGKGYHSAGASRMNSDTGRRSRPDGG